MKSDNYLNLCLEQASLSPFRHRHGCIVVKGGKVIGKGYNEFRSGYDGGALKTGQLPKRAITSKQRTSNKPKSKLKAAMKHSSSISSDFVPFEAVDGNGGGYLANRALTMHSEMMAINSALSSCGTSAATLVSQTKPYFKLSGLGAISGRLPRSSAIRAYVQQVCLAGQGQEVQRGAGSLQGQEWRFEAGAYQCGQESEERRLEEREEAQEQR
ncbi:hypothetical protein GE09DRAFT_561524 [Coniochaeta sp. 2T2.1]|nr:hypothetical protein GE09DRAFT_561524 [Coniochaeta sp. 2T2.1]